MKYFINYIYYRLNIWWSNFFWRKARKDYPLKYLDKWQDEDVPDFARKEAERLWKKFEYSDDGMEQLGDSTPPPAEMYARYCEQDTFSDDCDGYHAGLYHILKKNGIECYLLGIFSTKNDYGHCVVTYEYDGRAYIQDYRHTYDAETLEEVIRTFYLGRCDGQAMLFGKEYDYYEGKFKYKKLDVKTVEREE